MSARLDSINQMLKRMDSDLYARETLYGKTAIVQKRTSPDGFDESGADIVRSTEHAVCYLTDNWQSQGEPVEWGLEAIRARVQQHSPGAYDRLFTELDKQRERRQTEKENKIDSTMDTVARETAPVYKEAHRDINTAGFSKIDSRKLKRDKKNGISKSG